MSLKEALIELSVASPEEILDASARQELYGGDLITNLLDVRSIPETLALRALSMSCQLPAGPLGELPYAAGSAIATVPREVATSLGIFPYRIEEHQLWILASDAVSEQGFELLRRTTGASQIHVEVTLAPRVRQAIARDYSLPLDRRTRKLIARLEGSEIYHSSRAPELLADAPPFSELPRPTSVVPVAFFGDWADLETPNHALLSAETAPQPQAAPRPRPATTPAGGRAPRNSETGLGPTSGTASARTQDPGKHRGPYTVTQAKQDLQRAVRADQVLQTYFSFAAQYFDLTVCFTLHGSTARLRLARGLLSSTSLPNRVLTLKNYPALATVSETSTWLLTSLPNSDPELSATLGVHADSVALLLPVRVRERATLVLLGAFDNSPVELQDAAELFSFEPFVARALERLIVSRKAAPSDDPDFAGPTLPVPSDFALDAPERTVLPPVTRR